MSGSQFILSGKHLDQIDAALPALEAALVDARLDIVFPKPAIVDAILSIGHLIILGHELHPHVPQLATGQPQLSLAGASIGGLYVEQIVGDFGGQLGEEV